MGRLSPGSSSVPSVHTSKQRAWKYVSLPSKVRTTNCEHQKLFLIDINGIVSLPSEVRIGEQITPSLKLRVCKWIGVV